MSTKITTQDVLKALTAIQDPDLHRDIVSLGFVKDVQVADNRASFTIELTTPACPVRDQLAASAKQAVQALGVKDVEVRMTWNVTSSKGTKPANLIPHVKNTVAVASGKGGVGKSTVAANLAVALMRAGAKVGLMDTDVYGRSVPMLMGSREEPKVVEGKIEPPIEYGIKIISMAYFLPKGEAVIWRGPMLHKTMQQIHHQVVELAPAYFAQELLHGLVEHGPAPDHGFALWEEVGHRDNLDAVFGGGLHLAPAHPR